jgi:hypothetical protein
LRKVHLRMRISNPNNQNPGIVYSENNCGELGTLEWRLQMVAKFTPGSLTVKYTRGTPVHQPTTP